MASIIANKFTTYALSEDEAIQGSLLTVTQKQVIHNARAVVAEEKLALEYNPNNPAEFMQQEAYKTGYLAALSYLLEASEATEEFIKQQDNN